MCLLLFRVSKKRCLGLVMVTFTGHAHLLFELDTCQQFDTATFKIVIKILTFGTELFQLFRWYVQQIKQCLCITICCTLSIDFIACIASLKFHSKNNKKLTLTFFDRHAAYTCRVELNYYSASQELK